MFIHKEKEMHIPICLKGPCLSDTDNTFSPIQISCVFVYCMNYYVCRVSELIFWVSILAV